MKEYIYGEYAIKQERRDNGGFGYQWAVYKGQEYIGFADSKKVATEIADWHAKERG